MNMRKAKKVLFWFGVPFGIVLMLVGRLLQAVGEFLAELPHDFEGWCFEYEKHGWIRIGKGTGISRYYPEKDQFRNE